MAEKRSPHHLKQRRSLSLEETDVYPNKDTLVEMLEP